MVLGELRSPRESSGADRWVRAEDDNVRSINGNDGNRDEMRLSDRPNVLLYEAQVL